MEREAVWIPLGDREFGVGFEDATSHPAPGEIILYPGGVSETEILLAYGPTCFASKAGQLAGNHFITITENLDKIADRTGYPMVWRQGYCIQAGMICDSSSGLERFKVFDKFQHYLKTCLNIF